MPADAIKGAGFPAPFIEMPEGMALASGVTPEKAGYHYVCRWNYNNRLVHH